MLDTTDTATCHSLVEIPTFEGQTGQYQQAFAASCQSRASHCMSFSLPWAGICHATAYTLLSRRTIFSCAANLQQSAPHHVIIPIPHWISCSLQLSQQPPTHTTQHRHTQMSHHRVSSACLISRYKHIEGCLSSWSTP